MIFTQGMDSTMNVVPQKSTIRHSYDDQMTSTRQCWIEEVDGFHQVIRHHLQLKFYQSRESFPQKPLKYTIKLE